MQFLVGINFLRKTILFRHKKHTISAKKLRVKNYYIARGSFYVDKNFYGRNTAMR